MTSRKQTQTDRKIVIDELLNNPSADVSSIAEKCGFSHQKVRRIISSMDKNGAILSKGVILDPNKLGKRAFLLLFERSFKPVDERLKQIMTDPFLYDELKKSDVRIVILDNYYLMGDRDWASIVVVDTHEDLMKFIRIWRHFYGEYYSRINQYEISFVTTRNGALHPNLGDLANLLR